MEYDDLYQTIFKRKSVRKFDLEPLDEGMLKEIEAFGSTLTRIKPSIRIEIKILTGDLLRGLYKVQAPHYLAFYSDPRDGYMANAGFMLQQLDLFLSSKGLGCCWQGGIKPVGKAKNASDLQYVIALAFGRPAQDLYRKAVAEFKRKPLSNITDISNLDDLLEPARLAPSAMNTQSWYFTMNNHQINAYATKSTILSKMNQINVGIALCHVWLAAMHFGRKTEWIGDESAQSNPPKGYSYMASMKI